MKITSIFKKTAVFATATLLVLIMVLSLVPMASATEADGFDTYRITEEGFAGHGEKLSAMNVSQSGSITMLFYFTGLESFSNSDYLKVTVPQQDDTTKTVIYMKNDLDYDETKARWLVKVPVAAAQQTDLVGLQWVKNGVEGKLREYSVKYYADKVLEKAAAGDKTFASQVNNIISMLNYGSMAQKLFGHNAINLANKGLFTEANPIDNMLPENMYDAPESVAPVEESDVDFLGAQAYLQDNIKLRVYFTAPDGAVANVYKAGTLVAENVNIYDVNGTKYVDIHNIAAHNFATAYTVEVNGTSWTYSVLAYAKDMVEDYKSSAEQKNAAKALYLYYAWTKNYADSSYVPGLGAECEHGRSFVYNAKVYCSDCGTEVTTKVGLVAEPIELVAGVATDVTFTLNIAGAVDIKSLVVTLAGEGVTLAYVEDSLVPGTIGDWEGTAALNIVLDSSEAVVENCVLATVTYTVTAAETGTYKIYPIVREAFNGNGDDIADTLTEAYVVVEAKPVNCEEEAHDYKYDNVTDTKHRAYCDACQTVFEVADHELSAWEPVKEAEGGKVTGELFETRECACGYGERREVYYKNNIDSVKVNDTVINPYTGNTDQTAGVIFHKDPGYATFVITPENFVDKNGNALTFKDTDSFKTGGWFAVNGGVERYVIKINDGEWKTLSGTPGSTKPEDTEGIGAAINNNANITDKVNSHNNSAYQNGLTFSDLEAYANQTITVTLGAVPANNPGTAENPNVLITAVVEDFPVICTHLSQNAASVEATNDPTVFNATCACGETYTTSDVNDELLKMFDADEILTRTTGHNKAYSTTKMTEDGLDFVRFELLADKTADSEYLWYFVDNASTTAPKLTNNSMSDLFMIVYRASESYPSGLTMFVNQTKYVSTSKTAVDNSEWNVLLFDLSSLDGYDDTLGYITNMRLDIFDAGKISAGATFDIAYMGFFKDADHAMNNYKLAVDKYAPLETPFHINLDGFLVDDVQFKGTSAVINAGGTERIVEIDLANTTIGTTNSSLKFRGWLAIPSGGKSIDYRIIDDEGNASELRHYLVPASVTAESGIGKAGISLMYGDGRLAGAAFQSTNNTFDLSGYDGQTVTIEVVLTNYWGQTTTILKVYNVTVPNCANHVLVDVEAKASTCTTAGNEAYKTCNTCGRIYDTNEVELNAIPTLELDLEAHSFVDKAYTAPTTTEAGWEAHTACEYGCGKAWDAMGNEIEVPTIDKIVPTTNKYYGYDALSKVLVGGSEGSLWADNAPSADRTYVRYARAGQSSDGYINFMASNKAVTGQYMIIKYRTDSTTSSEVWANTTANGHSGGKANFGMTFNRDGEWHVEVFNLAEKIPSYVVAAEDGTYTIQWARIDILNNSLTKGYFDVAYIAFADDVSKFASIMQDGDQALCSHLVEDDAVWAVDANDPMFEKTDCIICGGKASRYASTTSAGLHIFTPDVMVNKTGTSVKPTLMFSENGMPYINVTAAKASGEETTHLFQDTANPIPGSKLGKYVGILYRNDHSEQIQIVLDGKLGAVQAGVKNFSNVNTNGAWKFEIVDVSTAFSGTNANGEAYGYDGSQLTAFRIDYFNHSRTIGDTVDIAFLAFFSDAAEAYAYYAQYVKAYEINCEHFTTTTTFDSNTQLITTTCDACGTVTATKACDHSDVTSAWDSAQELYTFTCDYCGKVETSDMIYKTEAITDAASVGSSENFLTATTKTEDGETFIRYTASETDKTDLYFYPYRNGSVVTGKYMVIKYRVSNGGTNLGTGQIFASSAATTVNAGATGTNQNSASSVWIDGGEWHTMIIQPKEANVSFTANADGTYSWRYLRINVNNIKAGNYVDIAEIAFADNEEAAKCYAYKNDSTVFFTNNLDFVEIDNVRTGDAGSGGAEKPKVVDLSGKTITNAATSLELGGWCVTPGGVAAYKLRVTSIDGVAVDNPELINWAKATTISATDAVTKQGTNRGFTTNCRLGARYSETVVNLSAWAGHTINFEIVIVTNYGVEVTIIQINNVTLPAAE